MKLKLKTLEDITRNRKVSGSNIIHVYHSKVNKFLSVYNESKKDFGTVIDVDLYKEYRNRNVYYKRKESSGVNDIHYDGQLYYDEWFEYFEREPSEIVLIKEIKEIFDIENW